MKILFLLLALTCNAQAAELKISAPDYEAAEKAPSYFKFIGHSRKLGIIGTSFEGYARQALLTFRKSEGNYEGIKLTFPVAELDTDNASRNEKMKETCLSQKDFPEISVTIKEKILTDLDLQEVNGEMKVRGETVPLRIKIEKSGNASFRGTSTFRLSEAKIPDPSILVASVKDEFEIEFQVNLEQGQ